MKIGDKVKFKSTLTGVFSAEEAIITHEYGSPYPVAGGAFVKCWDVRILGGPSANCSVGSSYHVAECELELIKDKDKNMNIKEKFTLAFKGEPEKSFRKTGITNGDDFLTDDGEKVFLGWLLKENGEKFKKDVVDGLLEDMEGEKK